MMRFFDWNKIRCLPVLMLLALILLTACADVGHASLIRQMERAGNTVTVVKIPVTESLGA